MQEDHELKFSERTENYKIIQIKKEHNFVTAGKEQRKDESKHINLMLGIGSG